MRKKFGFAATIMLLVCIGLSLAQEKDVRPPNAFDRLESIKNTDTQPTAIYVNQLANLSDFLNLTGGIESNEGNMPIYYAKCLAKIAVAKDKSALPWIESLLTCKEFTSEIVDNRPDCRQTVSLLRPALSQVWYDLQWDSLSAEDKMKIVFYGLIPDPKIKCHPDVSAEYVIKLGKDARKRVYEILLDKNLACETDSPYKVWQISGLLKLLSNEIFKPTDEELKNIYANGGEYGRMIAFKYAFDYASNSGNPKSYAIDWLKEMMKDVPGNSAKAYFVVNGLRFGKYSDSDKKKLYDIFLFLGNDAVKRMQSGIFSEEEGAIFATLTIYLERFGRSEATIKLFSDFLAVNDKVDLGQVMKYYESRNKGTRAILGYIGGLNYAAKETTQLLKKWSAKDDE